MSFAGKIALRYIFSKRSMNFITVITFISIIGITVGVAALISVLSIFNGFQAITIKQIIGFDPQFRIMPAQGAYIDSAETLKTKIEKIQGIRSVTPLMQGRAVALKGTGIRVFTVMGIPDSAHDYVKMIKSGGIVGRFDYSDKGEIPNIVIGAMLADRLSVLPNDTLVVLSASRLEKSISNFSQPQGLTFKVKGFFQTNIKDYDLIYAFCSQKAASRLYTNGDLLTSSLEIRLEDNADEEKIASALNSIMNANTKILSWKDINADLFQVMRFERMASFSILSIIIIIAVFNVLASLSMTVTEKKKDIGIMKAFGASSKEISKIYLFQGFMIGSFGSMFGALLGIGFVLGQMNFKWFRVDTNKYIIDAIPVVLKVEDVILVCITALVLSFLGAIYPAYRAGRQNIIESIKYE